MCALQFSFIDFLGRDMPTACGHDLARRSPICSVGLDFSWPQIGRGQVFIVYLRLSRVMSGMLMYTAGVPILLSQGARVLFAEPVYVSHHVFQAERLPYL